MVAVFTEPGRGRKLCPDCKQYVGAPTVKCVCSHVFIAGETKVVPEKKEITTFDGPGQGHKKCPACPLYVGVRTATCRCGHEFKKPPQVAKEDKPPLIKEDKPPEVKPIRSPVTRHGRYVATPSGKCPVRLSSTEREDVELWAHSVVAKGEDEGIYYSPSALKYFVREFYDMYKVDDQCDRLVIISPDWKKVCGIIDDIFSSEDTTQSVEENAD